MVSTAVSGLLNLNDADGLESVYYRIVSSTALADGLMGLAVIGRCEVVVSILLVFLDDMGSDG